MQGRVLFRLQDRIVLIHRQKPIIPKAEGNYDLNRDGRTEQD